MSESLESMVSLLSNATDAKVTNSLNEIVALSSGYDLQPYESELLSRKNIPVDTFIRMLTSGSAGVQYNRGAISIEIIE